MSNESDSTLSEVNSEDLIPPTPIEESQITLIPDPPPQVSTKKVVRARKRKSQGTTSNGVQVTQVTQETQVVEKAVKRRRKKKEPMIPLAVRLPGTLLKIGAHVSAAGGVQNAVVNALHIGGNAFGLFLKNQRRWDSPPLKEEDISEFRERCQNEGYNPSTDILPHGSYLVNLATHDPTKRQRAYDCFVDELKRCEALGIQRFNFHPGHNMTTKQGIETIAECINQAHSETKSVQVVLENSAGGRNSIGSKFEHLRDIIELVKDQSRVGVCIDTCHAFAAGYDLRTEETYNKTWDKFGKIVGFKFLAGLHLNDSRAPLGAARDLHGNLGRGFLTLEPFRLIVNDERMKSVPMILETPAEEPEVWAAEIKMLYDLVGKKAGDPEMLQWQGRLQELGSLDRKKQLAALEKKQEKREKTKSQPKKKKGKKGSSGSSEDESDESDAMSDEEEE